MRLRLRLREIDRPQEQHTVLEGKGNGGAQYLGILLLCLRVESRSNNDGRDHSQLGFLAVRRRSSRKGNGGRDSVVV